MFWYAKPEAEPTLLENPWRQTKGEWNDKYCGEIIQELKEFEVGDKITKAQCLLLGPVISGKSSFVNSVISICKKRYSNSAYTAGRRWTSVTREYFSFDCEDEIGKKFCLCDTAGMMEKEEHGFNVENIVFLIEGNVEDGYKTFFQACLKLLGSYSLRPKEVDHIQYPEDALLILKSLGRDYSDLDQESSFQTITKKSLGIGSLNLIRRFAITDRMMTPNRSQ